ncbi:MAG: hypothetical protein ABIP30_07605 [Ferruginibacter sp.]
MFITNILGNFCEPFLTEDIVSQIQFCSSLFVVYLSIEFVAIILSGESQLDEQIMSCKLIIAFSNSSLSNHHSKIFLAWVRDYGERVACKILLD